MQVNNMHKNVKNRVTIKSILEPSCDFDLDSMKPSSIYLGKREIGHIITDTTTGQKFILTMMENGKSEWKEL